MIVIIVILSIVICWNTCVILDRVWESFSVYLESVIAKVKPAKINKIKKRVDFELFQPTVAHVEMFQRHVRGEISSPDRRRTERVGVEIQL